MKLVAFIALASVLLAACAPTATPESVAAPTANSDNIALPSEDSSNSGAQAQETSGELSARTDEMETDSREPSADFQEPVLTVSTITGDEFSTANGPSVVYFMASWCPTCAQNWPVMSEVYPEYSDRVNMVAISIDPTDTNEVLAKLSAEKDFEFPVSKGNPAAALALRVPRQSTTIVFNAAGVEVYRVSGALSKDEWRAVFERAL